jgi:hypothetical protein
VSVLSESQANVASTPSIGERSRSFRHSFPVPSTQWRRQLVVSAIPNRLSLTGNPYVQMNLEISVLTINHRSHRVFDRKALEATGMHLGQLKGHGLSACPAVCGRVITLLLHSGWQISLHKTRANHRTTYNLPCLCGILYTI